MTDLSVLLGPISALVLAPLIPGIINRTKAVVAGRTGQSLLQLYADLLRLFRKGAVYSRTTSWVFKAGPVAGLSCMAVSLAMLPLGGVPGAMAFTGDLIVMVYLMGLSRFFTAAAAMDTGSAFEGMGASREVQFSVLAEPALLVGLAAVALAAGPAGLFDAGPVVNGFRSLSEIYHQLTLSVWANDGAILLLAAAALFIVALTENCRIPVDDPNTHLELTMIHEVMVLDHSGPDFGMILYAAALKLWFFLALLSGLLIPVRSENLWINGISTIIGIFFLAVGVGLVESVMARLRLLRIPQLLAGALSLSALALVLVLWG
ncbi:MAG: hydrogenase [Desulfobacteraceae bacterium]|jgi:formate hydrogenlyase subunit 4|nr:MAG: hydrogenase [Desulfobacteraceae bacterium]